MASSLAPLLLVSFLASFFALSFQAYAVEYYKPQPLSTYLPRNSNKVLNTIDSCWRTKTNWARKRRALSKCAVGFGKFALGGRHGKVYVVTTPEDDPVDPKPGTLRYGVIQTKPLWIIFAKDMGIKLKSELVMNSYKTIDGRGAKVEIAYGPCITIQGVSHIIIHGISIHDCKPGKPGLVRSSPTHVGHRQGSDGDAIAIFGSKNVWIDHCYLARSADGLIDVVWGSTAVTISNNYFTQHDKVMLCGNDDKHTADKGMKVTVVFNHFGPGLSERLPRVRIGYTHVANNRYDGWKNYAIGGSANPTIFSEGNYYVASNFAKEITRRLSKGNEWKNWIWRSSMDVFKNGAYFVQSGQGSSNIPYSQGQSFKVAPGSMVPDLTSDAGPLQCVDGQACS